MLTSFFFRSPKPNSMSPSHQENKNCPELYYPHKHFLSLDGFYDQYMLRYPMNMKLSCIGYLKHNPNLRLAVHIMNIKYIIWGKALIDTFTYPCCLLCMNDCSRHHCDTKQWFKYKKLEAVADLKIFSYWWHTCIICRILFLIHVYVLEIYLQCLHPLVYLLTLCTYLRY